MSRLFARAADAIRSTRAPAIPRAANSSVAAARIRRLVAAESRRGFTADGSLGMVSSPVTWTAQARGAGQTIAALGRAKATILPNYPDSLTRARRPGYSRTIQLVRLRFVVMPWTQL